ncbi:MAG TPA: hypothetical protein VLK84_22730 [Longimicrobium sp.]|nr:hypothetical protein [Longimicrobium sp.]
MRAIDLAADGVLQQGRGGGKQEDAAPRGQGGGEARGGRSQGGGREEARPSGERRQGGGQSARQTERGQQSGSTEKGRGRSSSSSDARGGSEGSGGRSNAAREERGNGSSSSSSARGERGNGNGASSASSRGERGNGNGASAASAGERGRPAAAGNGNGGGPRRDRLSETDLRRHVAGLSPELRRMAGSSRAGERMVAGAIARSLARGQRADAFDVRSDGGRLRVLNRSGALLLDLDDDRDLGSWSLRRLGDRQPAANAPAFCRSGQGHPVFGREWCLDKGHGLGSRTGTLWSRGGIDDVTWRRPTQERLDRGGLINVLGDVILGRLAFQSLALGYDQPLAGYWVAQPEGPRILRVHSGDYEVAELVDSDYDDRADVIYVVQPVW